MIELLNEIEATRGVPADWLCGALEEALQSAYRQHAGDRDVVVSIDRGTAKPTLFRRRLVVNDVTDQEQQISRAAAPARYAVGDFFDEPIDLGEFGRIAALTAKRVIGQRVLEWERERVFAHYRALQGTIMTGLVQREIHGSVYVVFEDGNEAVLPRSERCPNDSFAINDAIEAELLTVAKTTRGPALILSRSRASFVRAKLGNPITIVAAARRAGYVTVLATTSPVEGLARTVALELRERVQIIRHGDPASMVAQLLPAGSGEVFALEDERIVIVEAEVTNLQLELATQLCGWPVLVAEPGRSDVALEQHLTAIAARMPAPVDVEIDPELVRKLEEFAREREASID